MPMSAGQLSEPVDRSMASAVVKPCTAKPPSISIVAAVRSMSFDLTHRAPATSRTAAMASEASSTRIAFRCSAAR